MPFAANSHPRQGQVFHRASQADQNVTLGGSGDLRLFSPLELLAGGSSYEIAR